MGSAVSGIAKPKPVQMCSALLTIMQAQTEVNAKAKAKPPPVIVNLEPSLNMLCRVGLSPSDRLKKMLGVRTKCCPDWVIVWDLSNIQMTRKALSYFFDLLLNKDVWMIYLIGSEIDENLLAEIEQFCGGRLHCELYSKNQNGSESELVDLRIADLIRTLSLLKNIELVCFTGDGNLEHGEFSIISAVKAACSRNVRVHMYAPLGALSKAYVGVANIFIIDWSSNSPSPPPRTTPSTVGYQSDLSSHSSRSSSSSPPPLGSSVSVPNGGKCFVRDVSCDEQHSTSPPPMPRDLARILQGGQHSLLGKYVHSK